MSGWKYSDPALWEAALNAEEFPKADIAKAYLEWMKHPEYAILKNKNTDKIISKLIPKRGNPTYAKNQKKKIEPINNSLLEFNLDKPMPYESRPNKRLTKALFITLGTNPKVDMDIPHAWLNLKGHESALNKFNAYMKRIFSSYHGIKDIKYATHARREAYGSAYPHVHLLVILDDYIKAEYLPSKKPDKNGDTVYTWRVADSDYAQIVAPLKKAWSRYHAVNSYIDVQAVVNNRIYEKESGKRCSVFAYLMKYVTKDVQVDNEKAVYTHAMMKFFNMRDIFSKSFLKMIGVATDISDKDVRHDITITEFKQRLNIARREIRKKKRNIAELESYKDHFGFLLSLKKVQLDEELAELEDLERYVKILKETFQKEHPEYQSEWEYIQSLTLTTANDITSFFMWLEEYNTNCDRYSQDTKEYISSIAHLPFNSSTIELMQSA